MSKTFYGYAYFIMCVSLLCVMCKCSTTKYNKYANVFYTNAYTSQLFPDLGGGKDYGI